MSRLYAARGKARSMCSWAFELLRTETVCGLSSIPPAISAALESASARCKKGSHMPCAGENPDGCWRFKGMVIKDQSAHNFGCRRLCRKLRWDESSYRSVSGSRAIMIAPAISWSKDTHLRYCSASEGTLVISHVWSHGQGGRPHLDDRFRRDPTSPGIPPRFQYQDLGHSFEGGVHRIHTAKEQEERRKLICHGLSGLLLA